jgi:hypothetical protein
MSDRKNREASTISCIPCGAALKIPDKTEVAAIIRCDICQAKAGTWAEAKAEARKQAEDRRLRVSGVR